MRDERMSSMSASPFAAGRVAIVLREFGRVLGLEFEVRA
jgi:hypothetical protein